MWNAVLLGQPHVDTFGTAGVITSALALTLLLF